jgi:hypothetical protein
MSRFEADLALARANVRRMPSAEILAQYQADARAAAKREGARVDTTVNKLRAFIMMMAAPNSTSVR